MPAVYTRTGDKGDTGLYGGSRVPKQSLRVEAYGTVDEANSAIGAAKAWLDRGPWWDRIQQIQLRLFVLAAEVASDAKGRDRIADKISADDVTDLERLIDDCLAITGPQRAFVVPGRDRRSAAFHVARTVVRRAERQLLRLSEVEDVRPELIKYLNRCSDAVYSLARLAEHWYDTERITDLVREAVAKVMGAQHPELSADGVRVAEVLDLNQAKVLCDAAMAKAESMGLPIVFAAVDDAGNPVLTARQPGSLLASIEIAANKAWTAAAFKARTEDLARAAESELTALSDGNQGRVVLFGGGAPIWSHGRLAGAIGVSGGTVAQDVEILDHALSKVIGENR